MAETATRNRLPLILFMTAVLLAAVFVLWPGPSAVGDTLHRGLNTPPESFDTQKTSSQQASAVFRDIGEGLMTYTADGQLVPGAAESLELSDDGTVYTFHLREHGRWSNGDPVTAGDFVFAFRRLADPANAAPYKRSLSAILNSAAIASGELAPDQLGVRAIDVRTLEITLAQATPYFLSLLGHPSTQPMHAANMAKHGAEYTRPGNLVTNGPYRLAATRTGALVDLERNEHYWNNAGTAIDRVRYHVLPEPMSEYNRYRAGDLHITSMLPSEIFSAIRAQFPDEIEIAPTLGVYYYGLNLRREPFKDNPALREALSMAVDRDIIAGKVVGRGELPAYSWVPPGMPGYESRQLAFSKMSQDERNAQAKRLYRSAGFSEENPARFKLLYNTSDDHRRLAVAVQSMWRDVLGAEVELENVEFRVLLERMLAGEDTEVFRSAWNADYADAHSFLSIMASGHRQNLSGWESAEYDSLLERAASQTDPDARARYLEEAERILLAAHGVIPLYYYVGKHLVSPEVAGWENNILDYHFSHHLSLQTAPDGN